MRVSCDESDPGYANWRGRQFEVRVDGKLLTHCITADEESGWAMYQVVDQLGKHVWSVHGRELMARAVFGRVQITDITAPVKAEPPIKIAVASDVMVRGLR